MKPTDNAGLWTEESAKPVSKDPGHPKNFP